MEPERKVEREGKACGYLLGEELGVFWPLGCSVPSMGWSVGTCDLVLSSQLALRLSLHAPVEASASGGLSCLEGGKMLSQRPEPCLDSACGFLAVKDKDGIWVTRVFWELE